MGFVKEFKDFAMKGNVVDIAVAVIIGGAFGKIIDSLVNDIIMPVIGRIFGKTDFFVTLAFHGVPVGKFIQAVFNFLIIAFVLFLIIKAMNKTKKEEIAAPAEPSSTDKLLMEIRDALKK